MRMSDLRVEVPLAALDDDDSELTEIIQQGISSNNSGTKDNILDNQNNNPASARSTGSASSTKSGVILCSGDDLRCLSSCKLTPPVNANNPSPDMETFSETFSGSLEDLVGHFDEKITHCLKNFSENTETIAPVQVRTQEEIMNESQIWWTLTGNYGNILPIDWSRTYAHKLQLPALRLRSKKDENRQENGLDLSDDEELAQALDLHNLIATSLAQNHEPPPQTADQVIEEIDEIMQQSYNSELTTASSDYTMESADSSSYSPLKSPLPAFHPYTLNRSDVETRVRETAAFTNNVDKLKSLSRKKLNVLHGELETLIQIYNETLVQELALRDELEYEKELKNTLISLILSIQNKRRQYYIDKKRKQSRGSLLLNGASLTNGTAANLPQSFARLQRHR